MIQKIKLLLVAFATFLALSPSAVAQSKFDKWPELMAFHGVMSSTFHPSEEGNLEPIKAKIGEMVKLAEDMQKAEIPAEFNKKEVKDAVGKLTADSKTLKKMIQNKESDEAITKALSALHDTFHTIVEKCSHTEEHH